MRRPPARAAFFLGRRMPRGSNRLQSQPLKRAGASNGCRMPERRAPDTNRSAQNSLLASRFVTTSQKFTTARAGNFAGRGGAVLDCANGYQKEEQEEGGEEEFCPQEIGSGETVEGDGEEGCGEERREEEDCSE